MHLLTLVIGEDPDGQLERLRSKYDWYVYGGRFSGHLVLKPRREESPAPRPSPWPRQPGRVDEARKGDIDFEAMSRVSYEEFLSAWDKLEAAGRTSDPAAKWCYDIPESVTTRERLADYARGRSAHLAPTVVVVGGEWFGPWWMAEDFTEEGIARWDAWYAALLASLPDETLLTVIDCHV